jgi:hypothetical protein
MPIGKEEQGMPVKAGPIRRFYSKLAHSQDVTHEAPPSSAASDEPREIICAPKTLPKRCLNEGGHKALR